jgi:glycosyl transferase family 87
VPSLTSVTAQAEVSGPGNRQIWRRWRKQPPSYVLWAVWLVSRAILYATGTVPRLAGDVGLYQHWYVCCLARHAFPAGDPMWQYPPGAGLVLWLPGPLPGGYLDDFALLAVGCDLAVTVVLAAAARRGGSLAGAWYWVCVVPVLGPLAVDRLDMIPVMLSVVALCAAGRGGARGGLLAAAVAVKAWPVTLLAGTAPGQWRRVLAALAALLTAVVILRGPTVSFLAHQEARGTEIESAAAVPFMIWRLAGWHGSVVYKYGAWQLSGEHAWLVRDASRLSLILIAVAVTAWCAATARGRIRWRPEFTADAPLAVTLLVLVASPVLSPQYLLWAIGLAAACLAASQTTQRPAALAVLAAALLTVIVFPTGWPSLLRGSALMTGILAARNALLVAAAAASCWRLLGAVRAGGEGGRPDRVREAAAQV